MDIHKRKPWYGAREFLKEIGTIVIGVLIALGAGQAVEWLHWQRIVREERAALTHASEGIYGAMLARVDFQVCVDARLKDIATILKRHGAGEPLGITGPIGRPSTLFPDLSAFDMALADQTFTHMSIIEKERYFSIKGSYDTFKPAADRELEMWKTLRTLDHAQAFTPGDWVDVRKAYDLAVDQNEVLKNNLRMENDGDWLIPFKGSAKPTQASVRYIPWVKQLCQSSIVT
jgi:hypothetical protein